MLLQQLSSPSRVEIARLQQQLRELYPGVDFVAAHILIYASPMTLNRCSVCKSQMELHG